jgi:hypothetical protein
MGDDGQTTPSGVKPPNTLDGLPADIVDFLDCNTDKVELGPGKHEWLGGVPHVGDFLGSADVSFEAEKDGSVKATAKLGDTAFSGSASVKLKVDGDGRLSVDASDSTLLNAFKQNIDEWTNDVNAWFASNGKRFAKPTVRGGRVTLTNIAATAPPPDRAKRGFLAPVPLGEKVGAAALFAVAIAFALLLLPTETTTTRTVARPVTAAPSADSPQFTFTRVVTTESGGRPWSLLLIPGSALVLGGGLVLDETRRAQ